MTYPVQNAEHMLAVDELLELHTEFLVPIGIALAPARYGVSAGDCTGQWEWIQDKHVPRYVTFVEESLRDGGRLGCFYRVVRE